MLIANVFARLDPRGIGCTVLRTALVCFTPGKLRGRSTLPPGVMGKHHNYYYYSVCPCLSLSDHCRAIVAAFSLRPRYYCYCVA